MLEGVVDLIEIRILAVVGNERCENHRGRKGKGFFSMLIREELVIPNRNPNWVMRKGNRLIFLYYLSRYGNTRFVLDGFGYLQLSVLSSNTIQQWRVVITRSC